MKILTLYILFSLLFISCTKKQDIIDTPPTKVIATVKKKQKPTGDPIIGIIYEQDGIKVYGDTTTNDINYTSKKFEPYISFSDFTADPINLVSKVGIKLESNDEASVYVTKLKEGYKAKANFAGHYNLIAWMCGAPCHEGFLIDRQTGKIYNIPEATFGYKYKLNSKLLIVNPPDSTDFYDDCNYCKPQIFIFDENKKKFIEKSPGIH